MRIVCSRASIASCKFVTLSCLRFSSCPDVSISIVSIQIDCLPGRYTLDLQIDVQRRLHRGLDEPDDIVAKILDLLGCPVKVCSQQLHAVPVEGNCSIRGHSGHVGMSEFVLVGIRLPSIE